VSRTLCWFSCGAASAVAAKVTATSYADCEVLSCDTSKDEHEDNARFMADVEKWIGKTVKRLSSPKYSTITEVFLGEKYIVGPAGAPCTKLLKRRVREMYQRSDDIHVFGFTADERDRVLDIEERNPKMRFIWPLVDAGITKDDCYKILQGVGIELPAMYKLGFNNNNCIGCVKGGMGYWNKIRRNFPQVFERQAKTERLIGATSLRNGDGSRLYLDVLDPNAGRDVPEPNIECGFLCGQYVQLVNKDAA
jgi:hypothetical protein